MAMIEKARENAADYRLGNRVSYRNGSCLALPFDECFRVLKPAGRFCITDLRRDIPQKKIGYREGDMQPKTMLAGFHSSLAASYTASELTKLLEKSRWKDRYTVEEQFFGLCITGYKRP